MLAERKKRMKWTLNPRGNSWSKDTNKFGQRMLEKMGWKSGEGLGVNRQGITEHIKVAYKNDNKCLGYKDNDGEWVEHQSQFETLLAELSNSHTTASAVLDSSKDESLQTETLEQRSRHSRTRVHYQKFTRGKDLSRYSEKDLKCILGKQKQNNADEDCNEDEHLDSFYGVKTINSGTMNDYFKSRTNSLNNSACYTSGVEFREEGVKENNEIEEQCEGGSKQKKKRKSEIQSSDSENFNINDSNVSPGIELCPKKKKNCKLLEHCANELLYPDYEDTSVPIKKHKRHDSIEQGGTVISDVHDELNCENIYKKEKRKKRKSDAIKDTECEGKAIDDKMVEKQVKKKSKKKKYEFLSEDKQDSPVPTDVSHNSSHSKSAEELLSVEAEKEISMQRKSIYDDYPMGINDMHDEDCHKIEKPKTRKNSSIQDTKYENKEIKDETESKQIKRSSKNKKSELNEHLDASIVPASAENRVEVIKDKYDELDTDKMFKMKMTKTSKNISIKSTECEVKETVDEIETKQIKKRSKKKKCELPYEDRDILLPAGLRRSEEHLAVKAAEAKSNSRIDNKSSKEDFLAINLQRLDHSTNSVNEGKLTEQITEDITATKIKNAKIVSIENSVVEDISEVANDISIMKKVKKKKKNKKNEIEGDPELPEPVKEDEKLNKTCDAEELQELLSTTNGSSHPVGDNLESFSKSHEGYSVDEIKKMKLSLFVQLVDPCLVEFKGSNLQDLAGYGNW